VALRLTENQDLASSWEGPIGNTEFRSRFTKRSMFIGRLSKIGVHKAICIVVRVLLTMGLNVISKRELVKLIAKHPQGETELLAWYKVARGSDWGGLLDVRRNFPSSDLVGMVLIFNILGNQLRLITVASWRSRRIYVKALLTHKQYDKKEWMKWAR
jgi:mRNA interferase HigB